MSARDDHERDCENHGRIVRSGAAAVTNARLPGRVHLPYLVPARAIRSAGTTGTTLPEVGGGRCPPVSIGQREMTYVVGRAGARSSIGTASGSRAGALTGNASPCAVAAFP